MNTVFNISIVVTLIGMVFLGLAGISFRLRALANKKAWNGLTLPFAIIGLPVLIVGLVMLYFTYPY